MATKETDDKIFRLHTGIQVMLQYGIRVPEQLLDDLKILTEQRHNEAQEEIRQLQEEFERMKAESRLADEKFKEQLREIKEKYDPFFSKYDTKPE